VDDAIPVEIISPLPELPPRPAEGRRFLPSLKQLAAAAAQLPPAADWPEPRIEVKLVSPHHETSLTFRRVLARTPQGEVSRWVYEGKIFVS